MIPTQHFFSRFLRVSSHGRHSLLILASLIGPPACGGSDNAPAVAGTGGAVSVGGAFASGGSVSSSGGASSGNITGGTTNALTSGLPNTGGQSASSGGSLPTGGASAAGGLNSSTGGVPATGGTSAATGGKSATGGASSGGKSATGGSSAATGGTAAGGKSATGGSSAATGGTAAGGSSGVIGATPPMGWNSWNTFNCSPSDSLIRTIADAMVSSGMAAAGYQYVNIDDCWMNGRDASGNLRPDPTKFPNGISAVADYVHGKGLKLGIYEVPAAVTCAGRGSFGASAGVGSLGHETADAKSFASWGVDYLKYDYCWGDMKGFKVMKDALVAAGRPMFYSVNPASGTNAQCVPPTCSIDLVNIANMWRIGFDITNTWASFTGLIDQDKPLAPYAGPGHWNDPDMLEVGKGMSADEDRSHFGMWAMLAAPLIAGNDIRSMSPTTTAIMTNPDVIAVNQDPLGKQATVVATPATNQEIWSKSLSGTNARAVALFNRTGAAVSMTVQWTTIGLSAGAATVRDLWNQKDLGSFTDSYTATSVPMHGVVMLKIVSSQ
jgi:alpha-galactosidase